MVLQDGNEESLRFGFLGYESPVCYEWLPTDDMREEEELDCYKYGGARHKGQ